MEQLFALLPAPTAQSAPFWEACSRRELLLQRCEPCGHVFYCARMNCPRCGERRLAWQRSQGRGQVYSFTHVEVSFYGAQWQSQLPYTPVLVDLDEGARMLSRLVGAGRAGVRIGARVEVEFVRIGEQHLPYFRLEKASEEL